MGSKEYDDEKPEHLNDVLNYGYWIGRYSVTVGQWQEYIAQAGVKPKDSDSLEGHRNHPAVYVSWDEARAFCEWLSGKWRSEKILSGKWQVTLPSEAEWEKAARGGLKIPAEPLIRFIEEVKEQPRITVQENAAPKRRFPWGEDINPDFANYDSKIGSTSTVGCFPKGATPYGCEEMSGNVWEWCRSLWGEDIFNPKYKYPYDPQDGREELNAPGKIARVLRGGAFLYDSHDVRCAIRGRDDTDFRSYSIGFRVVLSPDSEL
jgi:iron(II)-dependent oxidoreductase